MRRCEGGRPFTNGLWKASGTHCSSLRAGRGARGVHRQDRAPGGGAQAQGGRGGGVAAQGEWRAGRPLVAGGGCGLGQAGTSHRKPQRRFPAPCGSWSQVLDRNLRGNGLGHSGHPALLGEQRTKNLSVHFVPLCSGQPEVFSPTGPPPSGTSFQSAYVGAPSKGPQGLEQARS